MQYDELIQAWRRRERGSSIRIEPTFEDVGLVLGAGTVLASGDLSKQSGPAEARLLTLLSVAYGRAVTPAVLGHLRRASVRWIDGEPAMASMHLALAGLGPLSRPKEAAHRLFLADRLLDRGADPQTILKALGLGAGVLARLYNPDQPRVPAGRGVESGRWTSGDEGDAAAGSGDTPAARPAAEGADCVSAPSANEAGVDALSGPPSPADVEAASEAVHAALNAIKANGSVIEALPPTGLGALARIASGLLGPTVFFGVLLIPTNATVWKQGAAPGHPGFFYQKLPGEIGWHISYVNDQGEGIEVPVGPDGIYRDAHGQAVARLLPNGSLALDLGRFQSARPKQEPAQVCPAPSPDKPGQGDSARSKLYENQMKNLLNPERPTPPNFGRALPNPAAKAGIVIFDDCWLQNGDMFEYKGPGYAGLVRASAGSSNTWDYEKDWLAQSLSQVRSAGSRRVVWCFAEPEAARAARQMFDHRDDGREKIIVGVFPYLGD
jgi:hypothetical protein